MCVLKLLLIYTFLIVNNYYEMKWGITEIYSKFYIVKNVHEILIEFLILDIINIRSGEKIFRILYNS